MSLTVECRWSRLMNIVYRVWVRASSEQVDMIIEMKQ